MAKSDYLPRDDEGRASLFTHVNVTLPQFFSALNLTAADADIVQQAADARAFRYLLDQQQTLLAASQQGTAAKLRLLNGDLVDPNSPVVLAFPTAPATVPSPVPPGLLSRFRALVRRIKANVGYTEAIGEALMIVGDETTDPERSTLKPILSLRLNGGQVEVVWKKEGMDALEIHVDRGDAAGFTLLAVDTRPNYVDTHPLPAAAARWKYKAIYHDNDARTGQWSAVVELAVGA